MAFSNAPLRRLRVAANQWESMVVSKALCTLRSEDFASRLTSDRAARVAVEPTLRSEDFASRLTSCRLWWVEAQVELVARYKGLAAHATRPLKIPAITYFRAIDTIIGPGCLTAVFGMGTGVATGYGHRKSSWIPS